MQELMNCNIHKIRKDIKNATVLQNTKTGTELRQLQEYLDLLKQLNAAFADYTDKLTMNDIVSKIN